MTAADLILLVVDAADPNAAKETNAVRGILGEIGASGIRCVEVYNKCDLLDEGERSSLATSHPQAELISASTGFGVRSLLYRVAKEASADDVTMTVQLPYDRGFLIKMAHERCRVVRERYEQAGLVATVMAPRRMASALAPYELADEG